MRTGTASQLRIIDDRQRSRGTAATILRASARARAGTAPLLLRAASASRTPPRPSDALRRAAARQRSRTMLHQMLARAGPFRHDRGMQVERAQLLAAKPRPRGKQIGEDFPVAVQARARAGANAILDRVVVVGIGAPALGKIDDADRGVTIGGDEHQAAYCLRARGRIARQQAAVRMDRPRCIRIAALSESTLPSGSTSVGICPSGLTSSSSSNASLRSHDAVSTMR